MRCIRREQRGHQEVLVDLEHRTRPLVVDRHAPNRATRGNAHSVLARSRQIAQRAAHRDRPHPWLCPRHQGEARAASPPPTGASLPRSTPLRDRQREGTPTPRASQLMSSAHQIRSIPQVGRPYASGSIWSIVLSGAGTRLSSCSCWSCRSDVGVLEEEEMVLAGGNVGGAVRVGDSATPRQDRGRRRCMSFGPTSTGGYLAGSRVRPPRAESLSYLPGRVVDTEMLTSGQLQAMGAWARTLPATISGSPHPGLGRPSPVRRGRRSDHRGRDRCGARPDQRAVPAAS